MKRIALSLALLAASIGAAQAETLKIAVVPVPHAEILEFLKPELAKQGVELDVKVFTDYIQPDRQGQGQRAGRAETRSPVELTAGETVHPGSLSRRCSAGVLIG